MITVLAVHFAVAAVAPFLFRKFGRNSFYALAAVPAGSFVWLLLQHGAVYSGAGTGPAEVLPWIPELKIELAFRMDALAWVMSLLVLGVGALVLVYCARYFKDKDDYLGGFGAQLLAFAGVMFGLVTADDLLLMFIFWELTTVLSYLLIGYARTRLSARRSALQALIVTTAGGLAMLVGLIILGFNAGTYRISTILELAPALVTGPAAGAVAAAVVLILVGAITKSALVPFHFWLPGAMAAPTPVSAYLHAAAMVKAGIYLVARLAPGFAETASWLPVVLGLGLATMLVGGYRALRQTDIKLILAYGTVSQLGFLTMVVGLGQPDAALAGLALLLAHGLFKATLFLVVGIIDHQAGTRDIRKLSGVYRSSRALAIVAAIGAASMAGIPPLAGFVAKESVFEAFVHYSTDPAAGPWGPVILVGVVLGSILTFAYSARFMWGAFAVKPGVETTPFKPIQPAFLAAPAILSLLTIVYGLWPAPVDGVDPAIRGAVRARRRGPGGRRRAPGAVARTDPGPGADRDHLRPRPGHVLRPRRRRPAPRPGPRLDRRRPQLPADDRRARRHRRLDHRTDPARFAVLLPVRHPHRGVRPAADRAGAGEQAAARRPLLHRPQRPAADRRGRRDRDRRAGRRACQQTLPGRADGVRYRLRHRLDVRAAGRPGPGADPDAGGNHHPGGVRPGHAQPPRGTA